MTRISTDEEERFLDRQKRLNTIHRNMMAKCSGDDSSCTTGPPMESTQAMRDRIRELSTISDDYDRAVLCVLNDLEALVSEKRVTILQQEYTDEDMAAVGRAFMEAIEQARLSDEWVKNWSPAQCPSEIIFDLLNRDGAEKVGISPFDFVQLAFARLKEPELRQVAQAILKQLP